MRFAAIDAETKPEVEDLLELCERTRADRVFLFRAAARELSTWALDERRRRDERYLDKVAAFLLADGSGGEGSPRALEPPERGRDDPRLSSLIAVLPDGLEPAGLPCTDRAVEMLGTRIGMAVPSRGALLRSDEDLDNATFWLAGGTPSLELSDARPFVLSPGALEHGGAVLVVEVERRSLKLEVISPRGELVRTEHLSLEPRSRLSVQG